MSRDTIRLPHDAYRLLQTLRAAGHSAYVVGGCVRDSLLGRLPCWKREHPMYIFSRCVLETTGKKMLFMAWDI